MKKYFTLKVKYWKVMKTCSIQAMIAITLCSLAFAHNNHAQVLDKKITLTLKEVSIEEALDAIEAVTDVKFFYSVDQLNIKEKISFEAVDRSLRDLLDELLAPYRVKYKVHERRSTITLKKENDELEFGDRGGDREKVGVAGPYLVETITGRVTDAATQQPMAGVNIIIKGTVNGTSSDAEGFYTINAENLDILVFSFIGYKTVEESVNGRSVIDIILEEDIAALEEVVVNAGYWQVKERENTGNIAKVTAKEIGQQPITTPLQALSGRVAGVVIRQISGVPGAGIDIQIRGQNSLRSDGNNPLYVIDGVVYPSTSLVSPNVGGIFNSIVQPINNINPSDIESIEVLKDADATAIYGSRGANGVVLITTKKGRSGKTTVDINYYTGVGEVSNKMDLLNTQQYLEMREESYANDGRPVTGFDLLQWDTTRYTDWQKELIGGSANYHNAQFSISGGNSNTQFLFSGTYFKQTTVYPGDFALKRGSGHFNMNHQSTDQKLKTSLDLTYAAEKNDLTRADLTRHALQLLVPNAPEPFDEEGNLNFENNTFRDNPFAELLKVYKGKTRNLISNMKLDYQVMPGLTLKANLGYNNIIVNENSISPIRAQNPSLNPTGFTAIGNNNSETWIIEPQAEYQKQLGDAWLNVLVGATLQATEEKLETLFGSGYASDALLENINAAPNIDVLDANFLEYRYNAIFSRINYNLRDKYILNLTGRRDGSSRFGAGKQFANFGAVGAAWIFSKEAFIESSLPFINFGKLRASYGTTGSDQIGNYEFLDTHSPTNFSYLGTIGLVPTRPANSDFGWETNRKLEGGVELGLINKRFFLTASYYRNRSTNQLVGIPLAGTTGFSSVQANFPATVENRGWEFQINSAIIRVNDFEWTSSFNLTIPRNELIEFPNIENSSFANTYTVGESLFNTKRFRYTGVDPETGIYTFEDINGDGEISNEDRQSSIDLAPDYFGGLQNKISYKGIELSFFFQFVKQSGINYLLSYSMPGLRGNQPAIVLDRWQQEGDITDIQRFNIFGADARTAYQNAQRSTRIISDASFIRLQNISLSYSFPSNIAEKLKIQNLRAYVQGQNVLTITNYAGLDPETQSSQVLPPLRVLTAGIQFKL